MKFTISGHHLAVSGSLQRYVREKLERVRRHFDRVIGVNVVLSVDKLKQKVEVTLQVRGRGIFAEFVHDDLYAAIDGVADKLDRQVLRYKDRVRAHPRAALKHQFAESPLEAA